jgi:transcriptional regulator with XRE-family HTH domain
VLSEKERLRLKKIGDSIRKNRLRQGITQSAMAHELNTSIKQYQRIEGGQINTGIISILRIVSILNTPIDQLLK